jgi:hypothetical protein
MHDYESVTAETEPLRRDDEIRVRVSPTAAPPTAPRKDTFVVEGKYRDTVDGQLELVADDGERYIPVDHVVAVRRKKAGSYWLGGLLVGAAVDAAMIPFLVMVASASSRHSESFSIDLSH